MSQDNVPVKGYVKNKASDALVGVSVTYASKGTVTDSKGYYELEIPIKQAVVLTFRFVGYATYSKRLFARTTNDINLSPILTISSEALKEVVVKTNNKARKGNLAIDVKKVNRLPGPNPGVENLLMTLPGVNNNNELSTQYNVRGGNFDENLVYVNGIEVYRPFLIRSGQQEGLSFVNSDMVQQIDFSAGGFQSKYGDRLSSVLDITYRKPNESSTKLNASLLGASLTTEGRYFNNKLSAITGVRYRDNSLFVNSKQIETNFRPQFIDVQSFLSYEVSDQLKLNFLGNFSLNDYNYKPLTRRTRFGTLAEPIELTVFYEGQENDSFLTVFGALSADYTLNDNLLLTTTLSTYNTQEEEYFDIAGYYALGAVDTNFGSESFGDVNFSEGIGSQINHARNDLDALISAIQFKATYKKDEHTLEAGLKFQTEDIKDRIREWEVLDSLGFSVRPIGHLDSNQQPYEPFEGPIEAFQNIRADNTLTINRLSGYVQYSKRTFWNQHQIWYNLGVRAQYWTINANALHTTNQFIVSPRAQFAIQPESNKDLLFTLSGGLYAQPPFYKELRGFDGQINPSVKAQKSYHIVLGNEYSFTAWDRPFKLTTEAYYKGLNDLNPYVADNVRIRYQATNNATAYAYGLDVRLNGEFVPGNDSWISIGYLKTEENINHQGNIARPTDQRLKFGILFQDYVPNLPDLKVYLNLVYNTGVPGGAPAYANSYNYQERLRDYKRADLGLSYIFTDATKSYKSGWLSKLKELTAGIELFNMFDVQNAITNTWVRDVYSKRQYGIPNFMTGRVLNFKLGIQF